MKPPSIFSAALKITLLVLLAANGAAAKKPKTAASAKKALSPAHIKPSDLDKAFAPLDVKRLLTDGPYALDIAATKNPTFDVFLHDAGLILGTSAIARFVIDDTDTLLTGLAGKAAGATTSGDEIRARLAPGDMESRAQVRDHLQMMDAVFVRLQKLPKELQGISKKATKMAQEAPIALIGNPGDIPIVVASLARITTLGGEAATEVPKLSSKVLALTAVIASCGCSHTSSALKPVDVDAELVALNDAGLDVRYVDSAPTEFNAFFKEVAVLQAIALLPEVWMDGFVKTAQQQSAELAGLPAASLKEGLAKRKLPKLALNPDLERRFVELKVIQKLLVELPARAKKLSGAPAKLAASVTKSATKMPASIAGLPSAIESSASQLMASVKRGADILPQVDTWLASVSAMTAVAGSENINR